MSPSHASTPTPSSEETAARGDDLLDDELRRKLPVRDPIALQALFDAYFDRLYGYVRGLVQHEQLAEDLTQDIFLAIHRGLPTYDPARKLRPWIFTIAVNRVRDHWRSRAHRDAQTESSIDREEDQIEIEDDAELPLVPLLRTEQAGELHAAIEKLSENQREVVVLRTFEERSFAEIGEILGSNEVAVRKRYSRALEFLRNDLGAREENARGAES